jgi:hypothetical protein
MRGSVQGLEGTSIIYLSVYKSDLVDVKDAAESVLYSNVTYSSGGTRSLKILAQTLRDAALNDRNLANHISSVDMGYEVPADPPTTLIHAFGGILTAARNLRRLSVRNSNLSLLAVTVVHQTHTRSLQHLTLRTCELNYSAMLAYIRHFQQLRYLHLEFLRPSHDTAIVDVPNVSWTLPSLLHLYVVCWDERYLPGVARFLGISHFCMLQEMDLAIYSVHTADARFDTGAQHFAQFFSRHPLHQLRLWFLDGSEALPRTVLPHICTPHLTLAHISPAMLSLMPHAVTKLHIQDILGTGEASPKVAFDSFDMLLEGQTGVREVTTDDWWGTKSWIEFLQAADLGEEEKGWQSRRAHYAALLEAKGIRFTDPQGKTIYDYRAQGL